MRMKFNAVFHINMYYIAHDNSKERLAHLSDEKKKVCNIIRLYYMYFSFYFYYVILILKKKREKNQF